MNAMHNDFERYRNGSKKTLALAVITLAQCASLANVAAAAEPPRSAALQLSSCKVPGVAQAVRCGKLDVPENPDRPEGRRLQISVVVIPAVGRARPDPIVPLMGGPGEDAISAAAIFADQFASLRQDRDLVLVDQRGTGRSGALRCDLYSPQEPAASLRDLFPVSAVERCEQRLSARADLTQYTYAHFANDLEQVRRALGYGSLNLSAGSYGTRAAQVYLRTYPKSVRTAYLGSVVPIDVVTPLTMARTAQTSLERTFGACAADSACHAAFPNLPDEFRDVIARLESGVSVSLTGRAGTAPLHRGRVVEWFRAKLYRPGSAATLPWLIHQAYVGNWNPIVDGILANAREADSALSFGLFFSITCSDDMAFVREADVVSATQGTFLGDYRVRQQQAACEHWPKSALPPDYRAPVHPSVPTLFVSGDSDGGTPLWFTQHVAPGFSDRAEVVSRGQGHTEWSDCIARIYQRFVRTGSVHGLDSSCGPVPRPPFRTE